MIPFAIFLLAGLSGEAGLVKQAAFTPEQPPAAGSPTYVNARVVAIDLQARTITVRLASVGKDQTFPVETQALPRAGALAAGQQVVLRLRAGGAGQPQVVERIERALGARPRSVTTRPLPPSPTSPPSPSPSPSRLPTDTVGPLRDPRVAPNADPRQNPLRDPRVIPGLSEPAPTPTPSPTATPPPR